jgi:hypothetical protein
MDGFLLMEVFIYLLSSAVVVLLLMTVVARFSESVQKHTACSHSMLDTITAYDRLSRDIRESSLTSVSCGTNRITCSAARYYISEGRLLRTTPRCTNVVMPSVWSLSGKRLGNAFVITLASSPISSITWQVMPRIGVII